jgi:flavin reductase (DIM6/NTAB) family NADH-FMN oxidoreductase RutF
MADPPEPSAIAQALGRIPTGLYVVSTRHEGRPLGFVGSFVMQVGFQPPTLCVAIGEDRPHLRAIRESGRFTVSILGGAQRGLMTPFFRQWPEGSSPFDQVAHVDLLGGPALAEALAWLDCRLAGERPTGDHVVVFGEIERGELCGSGEPAIHLRKNGLAY